MKLTLKRIKGVHFTAYTESGHQISTDGSAEIGGHDKGARPMEMVLVGLGGCSAIDVISILEKSRQDINGCEIEISAERADSIPAVFTKIHLLYRISGKNLDDKKIDRAISLSSEKYCSVTRMLETSAKITYDFVKIDE